MKLRIKEIFYSLQGESRTIGLPTVFIRLTGCPLRCQYCDTTYAFKGGSQIAIDDIMAQVASYKARYVCVTGGEPLAQVNTLVLLNKLCDVGYEVSLETCGALDISQTDIRASRVVDLKTPDSKEVQSNCYDNINHLTHNDQIKFVICSLSDYDWAKSKIIEYNLAGRVSDILFSPAHGQINPQDLANWIIKDNLSVRFQLQLHKALWNDEPGH